MYTKVTSPTRLPGGGNTAVRHVTRQSSLRVSVTIVDLARVGPDKLGIILIDELTTWTRKVSTLYFTLKL